MLDSYARLCSPDFLYSAWLEVEKKKGCSGADGRSVADFKSGLERNIHRLSRELSERSYFPSPLMAVRIPKDSGGFRRLGIPTVRDRVVFRAVNSILQEALDPLFLPSSFGYRPGKSVTDAVEAVLRRMSGGKSWFVRGDIRGCFDVLDWDILSSLMKSVIPDTRMLALLNKAVRVPVVEGGRIRQRGKGVPQGSPISPILANLYLHLFDEAMLSEGYMLVRYGDDWIVMVEDGEEALRCFHYASEVLQDMKIAVNLQKSGIGDLRLCETEFLGYRLNASGASAGANAWNWFGRALTDYKTSGSEQARRRARGELINIGAAYGYDGDMAALVGEAVNYEW